jgi:hypothetical protein
MSVKKKSPDFKLGAIWALRKIWGLLPIQGDEWNADMVYYLEEIQKELEVK